MSWIIGGRRKERRQNEVEEGRKVPKVEEMRMDRGEDDEAKQIRLF